MADARELLRELVEAMGSGRIECANLRATRALAAARGFLAAPVPAPAEPTDDARDAGRYRWLRDQRAWLLPLEVKAAPTLHEAEAAFDAAMGAAPAAEPVAQQPPPREPTGEMVAAMCRATAPGKDVIAELAAAWRAAHDVATKSQGATFAQQPEAPTLADDPPLELVPMLYNTATNFDEDKRALEALAALIRAAAARIESDAERIRGLEADLRAAALSMQGQYDYADRALLNLESLYAASRERERAAYERAAKVVDEACDKRIGEHALGIDVLLQLTALAAAIRALATPDSAAKQQATKGSK